MSREAGSTLPTERVTQAYKVGKARTRDGEIMGRTRYRDLKTLRRYARRTPSAAG